MRKKVFIFSLLLVFFGLASFSSFALESFPPEVNIDEIRTKMNIDQDLKGKTFNVGAFGYYYRIKVKPDSDSNKNVWCSKNIQICMVSNVYSINGQSQIRFQYRRKPPVSTFVAFDNGGATRGYEYTLLYRLGYTTDTYSNDRTASIGFDPLFSANMLYSSEMKEDTSSIDFVVDSSKQNAQLILVGDVYAANVELTQLQKLWFGDNSVWKVNVRMYVFSNMRTIVSCF